MSRTTTTATRKALRTLTQSSRPQLISSSSSIHKCRKLHNHAHAAAPQQEPECPERLLKTQLRAFFREMAQPVAVVTSWMPSKSSNTRHEGSLTRNTQAPAFVHHTQPVSKFHGATLSSFASIAMDPYPLVSFALRVPSRMATTLSSLPKSSSSHLVINLLSAGQADAAIKFSRPDLHPEPFREGGGVKYRLTEDELPVLDGVLGAMSCQLVAGPIPLHDLGALGNAWGPDSSSLAGGACHTSPQLEDGEVASELFIARVTRIEALADTTTDERTLNSPLLYYRRKYTSCADS
ncbi:hypothetical protein CVT24_000764 [Panaeolus cyanescens]|uniref:Flavin reductase like domain-containing protein n=1 Tax=Panaeolus cyanescens TaxID=181874 RepID=A0A409YZ55_9AGAR|nr:hypothetical protein CVT24_000764 [Panaeolus cyanescens]